MQIDPIFERTFRRLYGKPCWGVQPGVGTMMTLQFGAPHLDVVEPRALPAGRVSAARRKGLTRRRIFVWGQWHLSIRDCAWVVVSGGKRVGDRAPRSRDNKRIQSAAAELDGQALVRFSLDPRSLTCVFEFDQGATLTTRPHDADGVQWLLFAPRHQCLTLRADRKFSYGRSDSRRPQAWRPVARG